VWVDADACPAEIKELLFRAATRRKVQVTLVATSYFCPTCAGSQNYDENKFIRFRTWQDLKEGTWDDLSSFLSGKVVPYYLTPREEARLIAVFNHEDPGTFDKVYRLTISE
jgi:hypothetical protein